MGPQTTRSLRIFKLWLSLQVFGIDAVRAAINKGLELARFGAAEITRRAHWQLMAPPHLGVMAFRYVRTDLSDADNDQLNLDMSLALADSGFALISTTEIKGRKAMRLLPIHPQTSKNDIIETLDMLEKLAQKL
jgi:glutamate/tyrosine decarboxylase-like PLP-dependent enzyme